MATPLAFDVAPFRSKAYLHDKRRAVLARLADCDAGKTCAICERARSEALRQIDEALTKVTEQL